MSVNPQTAYLVAALTCAFIASVSDLRSRRIPNLLTGPAILFGLFLHLSLGGPSQLALAALSGLAAGGIFLLFFLAGGMGAGDVKLMAAVGCLAGTTHIAEILLTTVMMGGLMGVAVALYRGRLRETLLNVVKLVQHHRAEGLTTHAELNVTNLTTLRLPYAVPIAVGCLITFAMSGGTEWVR